MILQHFEHRSINCHFCDWYRHQIENCAKSSFFFDRFFLMKKIENIDFLLGLATLDTIFVIAWTIRRYLQ